jgi:hypothetical protein
MLVSDMVVGAKSQGLSEAPQCSPACGFGWRLGGRRRSTHEIYEIYDRH